MSHLLLLLVQRARRIIMVQNMKYNISTYPQSLGHLSILASSSRWPQKINIDFLGGIPDISNSPRYISIRISVAEILITYRRYNIGPLPDRYSD